MFDGQCNGRFFKLYLYTAIAPIPLSSFAGEGTSSMGKAFVKSYAGGLLGRCDYSNWLV